jgi:type I restriction enzyme M protein
MSEELNQRDLINNPEKIGKYDFRNIGSTSLLQLKKAGIIHGKDYKGFEKRKPDAIISIPEVVKSKVKTTLGIVENKSTSQFKTKKQKESALKQGLEVAQILEAKFVVITDTIDTLWANAKNGELILDEKGREIKTPFDPKNPDLEKLIEKIVESVDENNSQLKEPRLIDPTSLAKSVWQDLHIADGATPENCLYTFVELFVFKYLSDLEILESPDNYSYLISLYSSGKTNDYVLNYYSTRIRNKIKELFPSDLLGDKTTIINGTIFVNIDGDSVYPDVFKKILEKFGNEKEGGGEFKNIIKDFKSKLFETFLKESISKKNWGQFFTPIKVVKAIVNMSKSEIKKGITICDPACGVGKFILEPILANDNIKDFYRVEKGEIIEDITLVGIDKGFDKNEQKTIILAKANMMIYFSDLIRENKQITEKFSKLFNKTLQLKTKSVLGTLEDTSYENQIDLILTNPPYVTSGSSSLKQAIVSKGLSDFYKINAMGVEGLFMEWIIRSLKPGGKAFIVVPDGIFNRQNDKNLRQFMLDECLIDGIISLPLNTFFTTNKKTYILAITKKKNKTEKQSEPVFGYLVSEIGESRDIYRFDIEQNDLDDAVEYFNIFKGNKKGFEKVNNQNRCKTFDIQKFIESVDVPNGWVIDKWWSDEEKINLGILDKKEKISVLDFALLIEDVANTIKGFEDELKEVADKKKNDLNTKSFILSEIFKIEKGKSKYTRNFGNSNKGEFPVYSASNFEPLTHINTFDYDGVYLTWATNGFAGYIKLIEGKFSINGDRGLLVPKIEGLNLKVIKELLQPTFRNLAKGRKGENGEDEFTKVYPSMIENIEIQLPINSEGNIDINSLKIIEEQINTVNEIKSKISVYKKQIEELNVEIINNYSNKDYKIDEILEIIGEDNITKAYIEQNKGEYPVYSGQLENEGIFGYINYYKYDETLLTWVTYGNSGRIKKVTGKFNIGRNNCGLRPKSDKIDLDYIMYIVEPIFVENVKGEKQKSLPQSIVKNLSIPIPINTKGEFDLEAQKEIAEKYRKIEQIKKSISAELDKIANIEIDYE